jgi:hypothetical protein
MKTKCTWRLVIIIIDEVSCPLCAEMQHFKIWPEGQNYFDFRFGQVKLLSHFCESSPIAGHCLAS